MKEHKNAKMKYIIVIFLIIITIILIIFELKQIFSPKSNIIGTWSTDSVTVYEFNKNNTGKLIVSLSEYDFDYQIKDDTIFIDFHNDKSTDTLYKYSFEDNKLILKGDKGTFTFTKK